MLDRRAFLRRLGFGTVAAAAAANGLFDVERLLWVPGEKTIVIPALIRPTFTRGDIFTIDGVFATHPATGKRLSVLQQFVVTADVQASDTTLTVYPPIFGHVIDRNRKIQPMWVGQTIGQAS